MSKRILLTSLIVTIFVILFFAITSTEVYHNQIVTETKTILKTYTNVYKASGEKPEDLKELLDCNSLTVMDLTGKVIYDSNGASIGSVIDAIDVQAAISSGEGSSEGYSIEKKMTEVFYCTNTENELIRISICINSSTTMFLQALPTLLGFLVLDITLCLLFTWLATSFILHPVKELAQSAIGTNKEVKVRFKELQPIANVINQKNEYVINSQKSKDEFISNVTHEMNTPLTSIKGFAELIASGNLDKQKTIKAGSTILNQSERLSSMIAKILRYSELDDDLLPTYDLNISNVIKEHVLTYSPLFKDKKITFEQQIEDNVVLKTRHEYITEILDNLISNAVKYNKPKGSIKLTLTNRKLEVADTGIGIDREELTHIFSRFYTVDKSHGENTGFGLGLSIVKKLCDRSHWKLTVDSTKGEGTVFTIEF